MQRALTDEFVSDTINFKDDFTKALDTISGPREYRFLDKSGETRWCRVNSRPISEGPEKIGIQGVLVDVTRSKYLSGAVDARPEDGGIGDPGGRRGPRPVELESNRRRMPRFAGNFVFNRPSFKCSNYNTPPI